MNGRVKEYSTIMPFKARFLVSLPIAAIELLLNILLHMSINSTMSSSQMNGAVSKF
jgi:hypothetical protein